MTNKTLILLYHDLESDDFLNEKENEAARDTVVNVAEFDRQMLFLAESGYSTVSINEYLSFNDPSQIPHKVIITFDDGHYSNYHLAYPILRKYGFTATFFIVGNRIGRDHYMTEDHILELSDHGMEIGSHGYTHEFLPLMNRSDIRREMEESKTSLEFVIKRSINFFAFPGGHYNREVVELLPVCGYKGACSCLQGLNPLGADPWLLKRIEVRKKTSIKDFLKIFRPTHILLYQLVDKIKLGIRKIVGLEVYARLRQRLYKLYLFKR
jgi:peptidoglycan/xylan/chitin deacetylase (PgdA/CDA1 family)